MDYTEYEHQKRIPRSKQVNIEKFIRYGGYYDVNNNWNSIVTVEGYPDKIFRGRVEVFLFKDNKIYMDINEQRYRIPGGSFDIRRSHTDQVYNEIKEEAKIISKNIYYTGLSYVTIFSRYTKPSSKRMSWNGTYNEVYLAEYDHLYRGRVNETVYDYNMHHQGKFYILDDVLHILKPEHLTALKMSKII